MFNRLLQRLHQKYCHHRCFIEDIVRLSPMEVECRCHECGVLLKAPHGGLLLKAVLEQKPVTSKPY